MSVQFGRWNLRGAPPTPDYFEKVRATLALYGPDGGSSYSGGDVTIFYRAFHTTKESCCETQPLVSTSGAVITWDGRLDNRAELINLLKNDLSCSSPDVSIVAAAYEQWGNNCFARLIGDWALSVWKPSESALVLAKDPVGPRHLYYSIDTRQVVWSTILDPIVLLAKARLALDEEYIAGWFSFFPAPYLTPYVGIHAVPPSCFISVEGGQYSVRKYWNFDPSKRIVYRTDVEYEEHFRDVFAESVRRRLRSNAPILAELSGGMDSSSIVCMADTIVARDQAEAPRLDTLSYYDDSEPNWNERPYFTKVEEKRGRVGCHINVGLQESLRFDFKADSFIATPESGIRRTDASEQLSKCMAAQGNRVVLSGIGGDEVAGGVPTPIPELEDLFARVQLMRLARQLKVWALNKRKPWFHLLYETTRGFLPVGLVGVPRQMRPAPWLCRDFVNRNRVALTGYPSRVKLFGSLPSFQNNLSTLQALSRQLECSVLPLDPPHEKRYPYLDRNLLEFLYAIPREQLVRPGQRRSLMRRMLVGIVPQEILSRRRKAYLLRSAGTISSLWSSLVAVNEQMVSTRLGIVDSSSFCRTIQNMLRGCEVPVVTLMRTLGIELWLRTLVSRGMLQVGYKDIARDSSERTLLVRSLQ
jgi:asparagine synthase (glutamine-hydrolysing)